MTRKARNLDRITVALTYAEWSTLADVLGVASMEAESMPPALLWQIDAASDPASWGRKCGCRYACDCGAFAVTHADTAAAWTEAYEWLLWQSEDGEWADAVRQTLRTVAAIVWHGGEREPAYVPWYQTVEDCADCMAHSEIPHFVCVCSDRAPHCAECRRR